MSKALLALAKKHLPNIASLALPSYDETSRATVFLRPGQNTSVSGLTALFLPLIPDVFAQLGGYKTQEEKFQSAVKDQKRYKLRRTKLKFPPYSFETDDEVVYMEFVHPNGALCGLHYDPAARTATVSWYPGS